MEHQRYFIKIRTQIYICLLYIFIQSSIASQQEVHLQVHQGYTEFRWTKEQIQNSDVKHKVFYQVMGTKFHSVIDIPPGGHELNITTSDYPGSLYLVKLYVISNGSNTVASTRTFRAGCSYHFNAVIGQTFHIQSPGFPLGYHSGVVCQWSYNGTKGTWYKVTLADLDLPPAHQHCSSYLELIGYKKYCGKMQNTNVIPQKDLNFRFYGRTSGKGFNATVTAIPILTAPHNVTVTHTDQYIHVNWSLPDYSVDNMTFVLGYRAPPSGNETRIELTHDTSQYDIDTSSHNGQTFSIQMYTKTPFWQSQETNPIIVQSNCHHDISLQGHQEVALISPGYPTRTLPEETCSWIVTTTDAFFVRFTFEDFNLNDNYDTNCRETFLEISNNGRFCNTLKSTEVIIKKAIANVTMKTGTHTTGSGFNVTIKAVAKPTNPPNNVRVYVNESQIKLTWAPPSDRQDEITRYVILYDVVPDTANQEVKTKKTYAYISTHNNRGRMFIIRIAAETEGGRSVFTKLKYVRAECGMTRILEHRQSIMIFSPSVRGSYQPGVVCKWKIGAHNDMFLKITINRLEIENTQVCSKDYLQISSGENIQISTGNKLCGYKQNKEILVKSNTTNMIFLTDFENEGNGFIVTINVVAPPPGQPTDLKVVASHNALVLSWKPPFVRQRYMTGYIINYRLVSSKHFTTIHVPLHLQYHAINTVNTQGLLYEVNLQANGESEPGPKTAHVIKRSHCGYNVNNFTEPVYISSPKYPFPSNQNCKCNWHLNANFDLYITILDLQLSERNGSVNGSSTDRDIITITGIGDVQNHSLLGHQKIIKERDIWIRYQTFTNSTGFLLQISNTKFDNDTASSNAYNPAPAKSFLIGTASSVPSDNTTPSVSQSIERNFDLNGTLRSIFHSNFDKEASLLISTSSTHSGITVTSFLSFFTNSNLFSGGSPMISSALLVASSSGLISHSLHAHSAFYDNNPQMHYHHSSAFGEYKLHSSSYYRHKINSDGFIFPSFTMEISNTALMPLSPTDIPIETFLSLSDRSINKRVSNTDATVQTTEILNVNFKQVIDSSRIFIPSVKEIQTIQRILVSQSKDYMNLHSKIYYSLLNNVTDNNNMVTSNSIVVSDSYTTKVVDISLFVEHLYRLHSTSFIEPPGTYYAGFSSVSFSHSDEMYYHTGNINSTNWHYNIETTENILSTSSSFLTVDSFDVTDTVEQSISIASKKPHFNDAYVPILKTTTNVRNFSPSRLGENSISETTKFAILLTPSSINAEIYSTKSPESFYSISSSEYILHETQELSLSDKLYSSFANIYEISSSSMELNIENLPEVSSSYTDAKNSKTLLNTKISIFQLYEASETVSSTFQGNPITSSYTSGYSEDMAANGSLNNKINFDVVCILLLCCSCLSCLNCFHRLK